jgi:Zn-dependent peptidase ImmA (M78 family)
MSRAKIWRSFSDSEIVQIAESLGQGDDAVDRDQLLDELQGAGVDPAVLKAHFHQMATKLAERERTAKRAVPLALEQAIEQTLPARITLSTPAAARDFAERWLEKFQFPSPFLFASDLETARAYRKSSHLSESDQKDLDRLEADLRKKAHQARPREEIDLAVLISRAFLRRFGVDCRERLPEVARELGLEVLYRPAESYEGALLRIKDAQLGLVVINSKIREESRKRFTLAHEVGHFVLPGQHELSIPCTKEKIESWNEGLYRPELEANRFAAEILMPRELLNTFVGVGPTMASVRSIARLCGTSLTASAVRLVSLTSFRAAVVWSQDGRVVWHKSSVRFVRWLRKGALNNASLASKCFEKHSSPDTLEAVPASAWLFEKGLKKNAKVWEQSVALPGYDAVLSLLVMREPVEREKE